MKQRRSPGTDWTIGLLCGLGVACQVAAGATPARFVARLANGQVVEGNSLLDWHAPETAPKLEGTPLFDSANPARWLIDRSLQPSAAPPEAFLEMVTGDCLPGTLVDYRSGDEWAYSRLPPNVLVRYDAPNLTNLEVQPALARVDLRAVRRIVWSRRRGTDWQPRTAFLRDGSELRFRSLRWSAGSVSLLLESGPRRVAWSELAELHLPPIDYWGAYFYELATLTPDGTGRLMQLETTSGLIATTSMARTIPRVIGDTKDVQRWLLGLQPAWSLDVIWVRQGTVWNRRFCGPQEILLSRVFPTRATQRSFLRPSAPAYSPNRSLFGSAVRSAAREAGWGFGVQARSELEFDLPAAAKSLRAEFSLDPHVQEGGCVQPGVLLASAGNAVLFQGPILVGAERGAETGTLALSGAPDSPRKIALVVDPVLANRPPKADPLEIRDQGAWLDPLVEMDPALVKTQLDQRLTTHATAWRGWTVTPEPATQPLMTVFLADGPANSADFRTVVSVASTPLKLSRAHVPNRHDQWLVLDAVRTQPPGPPAKISVKVGDQMPLEWDPPTFDKSRTEFKPLIVPLALAAAPASATEPPSVAIEIRQWSVAERVPLLWRAIQITDQHPAFHRILEDTLPESRTTTDAGQNAPLNPITGGVAWDDAQKHSGLKSLRIDGEGRLQVRLDRPVSIRERPQLGEHRFLRFAVRKQGGGGLRMTLRHASEADRPAAFVSGPEVVTDPGAKRLTDQPLGMDWQVFTRDLYGDFGDVELAGLELSWTGGEFGWLDHVYLARTQSDFEVVNANLPK